MYQVIKVGSKLALEATEMGLKWLAKRHKNVSKHIGYHTVKAANAARRNAKYLNRALGNSPHSIFRDPRPKKLVERVLKSPDQILQQTRNGRLILEKQFDRAIGKAGERIVKVVIDPKTGRIITAYPIIAFTLAGPAGAQVPEEVYGDAFDSTVIETIDGIDAIIVQWQKYRQAEEAKSREDFWFNVATFLLDALLDPTPAGDPDEGLYVQIQRYAYSQADKMIREVEEAIDTQVPEPIKKKMRDQFFNAVSGISIPYEDDD